MPSKSPEQAKLMRAVAHNKAFAKKVGIPQNVGEEFVQADKRRNLKEGGNTMATGKKAMEMRHAKAMEKAGLPKKMVAEERKEAAEYKKGGKTSCYAKGGSIDGIAQKGKTRGRQLGIDGKKMPSKTKC